MLGLLKEQDMHGYELKKRLADVFGLTTAVSFGSLYPALARLEAAGAVLVVVPPKAPAAPTGSPALTDRRASRRRKVYGITPLGAKVFEDLLAGSQHSGEDERSFNLRLPSPGTCRPRAGSGSSSSAEPFSGTAWPSWRLAPAPGGTTVTCGSCPSVSRSSSRATFPGWTS